MRIRPVTASGFGAGVSAWMKISGKSGFQPAWGTARSAGAAPITYTIGEAVFDLIVHQQLGEGKCGGWSIQLALKEHFLSRRFPHFYEAAKEVGVENAELILELPQAKQESNLNLLTEEEKQFLEENYQITFATPDPPKRLPKVMEEPTYECCFAWCYHPGAD